MTGRRRHQNMRNRMDMNFYNPQFYQSKYGYNNKKKRLRRMAHYNRQYDQYGNNFYNYGQEYQ